MGQLERYGLYVLCLVIFLILGIAIWGDNAGAVVVEGTTSQSLRATSNIGPGDTISEEQRRRLEEEANVNEVLDFISPRPKDAGLSQGELARRAGVRVETLCRVERGKQTPSTTTIAKLERALNGGVRVAKKRRRRDGRSKDA